VSTTQAMVPSCGGTPGAVTYGACTATVVEQDDMAAQQSGRAGTLRGACEPR
jgi:hypothetical protein